MHQSKGRKKERVDCVDEMVVMEQDQHLRTGGRSLMAAWPPSVIGLSPVLQNFFVLSIQELNAKTELRDSHGSPQMPAPEPESPSLQLKPTKEGAWRS